VNGQILLLKDSIGYNYKCLPIFFNELKLLPQWDKTFAWGYYGSLRICEESRPRKSYKAIWKPEYMKTNLINNVPFLHHKEFREERSSKRKVSVFDSLKMEWHRIVDWKFWGRLANLILGGTIYGFRIFIYAIQKIVFLSQRIIKRFIKHRSKLACIAMH
jgi:hypothetical protein